MASGDAPPAGMKARWEHWIDGKEAPSAGGGVLEVRSPFDGALV